MFFLHNVVSVFNIWVVTTDLKNLSNVVEILKMAFVLQPFEKTMIFFKKCRGNLLFFYPEISSYFLDFNFF
jgi:hypothetical protein